MGASLAKGSILGGLIFFFFGFISWSFLPFHLGALKSFSNGDAVIQAVQSNATQSGIYVAPAMGDDPAAQEKMARGPFVFASVRVGPLGNMGWFFGRQLLTQMLGAMLISWLLLQSKLTAYGSRVLFVVVIAVTVGVLGELPNWNWWGFSTSYVLADFVDLIVGWGLAGLVMAKVVK